MAQLTLPFGTLDDGSCAHLHLLTNRNGMVVGITDIGASLVMVKVPDAKGNLVDVTLGWGGALGYCHNEGALGAIVGRVANRIAGAQFNLEGESYELAANEGRNSLHSGPDLWYERLWQLQESGEDSVTFGLVSPAGDQGYPGEVRAQVTYSLSEDNVLTLSQSAHPSVRTPLNLTCHAYWNLDGHASGSILGHSLSVEAAAFLPVDAENIPTGAVTPVDGTLFDLRKPRRVGSVLDELPAGYDHNFCLSGEGLRPAARLVAERSGIVMDMATDAPGLQVYAGRFLDSANAKDGARYGAFAGIALEPQGWPDALHHDDWPSIVHGPQDPFTATSTFAFSTIDA